MIRHFKHGLLVVICLILCGCGSSRDPKRYHVSGTVTLDGQPMAEGVVRFATFATGVNESFDIKEGKFTGMAADGERRVEIHLLKAMPIEAPGGVKGEIRRNVLPTRYSTNSKLTAKVTPEGPNEFKFEVTSK